MPKQVDLTKMAELLEQKVKVPYGFNENYIMIKHKGVFSFEFLQEVNQIAPIFFIKHDGFAMYIIYGDFPSGDIVRIKNRVSLSKKFINYLSKIKYKIGF